MSLSLLTSKINKALRPSKDLEISGVKFAITVPSYEHQAILDDLTGSLNKSASKTNISEGGKPEDLDEDAIDVALAEELSRRTVAYSLLSVDGQDVTADHAELLEELRKWPAYLVSALSSTALNFRYEVAARLSESVKYEWFDIKEFTLAASASAVHAAVEEKRAQDKKPAGKYQEIPEDEQGETPST